MDIGFIISNTIFIVLSVAAALLVPGIARRVKSSLLPPATVPILQAIILGYAIIFGIILPVSRWLANRGLF